MTFHALTCTEVHVDAMDVAGDNQMRIEHSMVKQRISASKSTPTYHLQPRVLLSRPCCQFTDKAPSWP